MSDGTEPITDDEILYRRIPTRPDYYNPDTSDRPSPLAFRPRDDDTTGLSVFRAKYVTPTGLAENDRGKRYFIGFLRASVMRSFGMDVVPDPIPPTNLGHAEIPDLTSETKRTKRGKELMVALAERVCYRIEGPFPEIM